MSATETSSNITQTTEVTLPSLHSWLGKHFQGRIKELNIDYNGVFDFVDIDVIAFRGPPNEELLENIAAAIEIWVRQSELLGLPLLGVKGHVRLDDKVAGNDNGLSRVAIAELREVAANIEHAILASGQLCPSELYLSIGCRDGEPVAFPTNPTIAFTRIAAAPLKSLDAWAQRHTGWLTSGENLGFLYRFPTATVDSSSPTIH